MGLVRYGYSGSWYGLGTVWERLVKTGGSVITWCAWGRRANVSVCVGRYVWVLWRIGLVGMVGSGGSLSLKVSQSHFCFPKKGKEDPSCSPKARPEPCRRTATPMAPPP